MYLFNCWDHGTRTNCGKFTRRSTFCSFLFVCCLTRVYTAEACSNGTHPLRFCAPCGPGTARSCSNYNMQNRYTLHVLKVNKCSNCGLKISPRIDCLRLSIVAGMSNGGHTTYVFLDSREHSGLSNIYNVYRYNFKIISYQNSYK